MDRQITGIMPFDREESTKKSVQLLCSDSVCDQFFVDSLVSQLSNRANSELVAILTKVANKPLVKTICQRLSAIVDKCRFGTGVDTLESRVILLISLLSSSIPLRLSTDESRHWIEFLTREAIADNVSLKISLATILASPNLMPDQVSFRDEKIGRNLISFFSRLHFLIQKPEYSLLSNMMILIYVHMITDNADDLANLLSNILGHKVPRTLDKQPYVRELYIGHALNEEDVVKKATNISVTKQLNAGIAGYLPVHCICALLHWRSFSRYSTPIQAWVKAQLIDCQTPVHPFVAHLLENFASSCIPTETFPHYNQTIDESFFEELFSGDIFDESRLVLRVLSLTYLVAFTYKLDVSPLQKEQSLSKRLPEPYSRTLWKSIPIRYLLIMTDMRHNDFQYIRPMLLRYLVLSMIHLLPEQMHFEALKRPLTSLVRSGSKSLISTTKFTLTLQELFATRNFVSFSAMLDSILDQSIQQQFHHYDTIVRAMAHSLDDFWPRSVVDKVAQLWERFDSIVPRRLHEDTLRLWLTSAGHVSAIPQLEEQDNDFLIAHTPLLQFRADERVFRSAPHLRCFCRLLSFYLAASRDANSLRLAKAAPYSTKSEMAEKEELFRAFIGTQRLTVVQVFIELCDGDPKELPYLEEIRQILCSQIHQFFIADAHLPKLVHFNMYPIRLIPVIVRGVPSAHVLINSMNELLSGINLERRIFAIVLMTELLEHYKIPNAFAALTLISDLLDTLISNIVDEEFIVLMLNITPSLARLIKISPFHAEYFLVTLHRTRKLVQSRLALYTSLTEARISPEQKLFELIGRTLDDLQNRLQLFTPIVL